MDNPTNPAERLVFEICRKTFLSLWSYANPQGKHRGKELCDVLVVCPPDVIVVSVKDISLHPDEQASTAWERWQRRAIEQSVKQVYGAERWIRRSKQVIRSDGSPGMSLPSPSEMKVHRIAIAAGSNGRVPIPFGDFGKGFVHVLDEVACRIVLGKLDTITDFVDYLSAKEDFCKHIKELVALREEDLLAVYVHGGREFPVPKDIVVGLGQLWEEVQGKPEFAARKRADEISYVWDRLIDRFAHDVLSDRLEPGSSPTRAEKALRVMARENRFSRRILGNAFKEFLDESQSKPLARMLRALSGVVYVFLAYPRDSARKARQHELAERCFVARGLYPDSTTVLGIATEQYSPEDFSLDICLRHQEEWTADQQSMMEKMQREKKYFVHSRKEAEHYDEYPAP